MHIIPHCYEAFYNTYPSTNKTGNSARQTSNVSYIYFILHSFITTPFAINVKRMRNSAGFFNIFFYRYCARTLRLAIGKAERRQCRKIREDKPHTRRGHAERVGALWKGQSKDPSYCSQSRRSIPNHQLLFIRLRHESASTAERPRTASSTHCRADDKSWQGRGNGGGRWRRRGLVS